MRCHWLTLLILLLAVTPAQAELGASWPARVAVNAARVRGEPNLEAAPVAKLKKGVKLQVRWLDGEWLEIMKGPFPDRFLHKKTVTVLLQGPDSEFKADPTERLVVKSLGTDVRVRMGGKEGEIVAKLSRGKDRLEVRRVSADWAEILSPEKLAGSGVATQYLELIEPPAASASH